MTTSMTKLKIAAVPDDKPVKVTQTFSFDQLPEGAHSIDSVVLEDHGDKTVYRATSTLPDLASRDGMLASGMETGVVEGFERLDAMLEAMSERSLVKPLIAAIIAVGPEAIPELANSLRNEDTPRLVRLSIPRVLHGIGTMEALEVLRGCFGTDDEGVRQKCLASASRLREELQAPALPPQTLKPWIQREIEDHVTARDGWLSVRP